MWKRQLPILIVSSVLLSVVQPVQAEESPLPPLNKGGTNPEVPLIEGTLGGSKGEGEAKIPRLSDQSRPAMTVKEWLSQRGNESLVQVTAVKANPTQQGVEVILQTFKGEQLQIVNRSAGNSYIADIPNAQLRLPSGEAFVFRSEKPITGITEITVINQDANTIRVTVTGEAGVPTVELFVSEDNSLPVGDKLENAPLHSASLWTTYEFQRGRLEGFGFGTGVFFVGDREARLPNTIEAPSYVRADATLFYRQNNFRATLGFKNLFNVKYYDVDYNLFPGAPFTVLGTVSVNF